MKGYSLTRRAHARWAHSHKPPGMNDMKNISSAATGNQGGRNEPEERSTRPPEPPLCGKTHTVSPAVTADETILVEDGSKAAATKVPGTSKVYISEDLTRKYRPEMAACGVPETNVGNSPSDVGISHQRMEARR